jgi:hypothetical protein
LTQASPKIKLPSFARILLLFLVVETLLLTWAWGVRRLMPNHYPEAAGGLYKGVAQETNPWLEPWQRWDTTHYQAIAERGYSAFDTAYFTPPVYPFLMWGLAPLFGGNTLASGLFISGLAFLGCLLAFHRLALLEFGEETSAMRAAVYLAIYPAAFFLVAAYSESIFFLFAILCLFFIRKENWLAAGLFGGLASLTRIPGVFLLLPMGYAAWQAWKKGSSSSWSSLLVMGSELVIYYSYQWFYLGQPPTAILAAQSQRGGYLTFPGLNILESTRRLINGPLESTNTFELFFTAIFIGFTILVWKKLPRVYGLYAASLMFFFLARMGNPEPLISMIRYTFEIFPVILLFSVWGSKPVVNRVILYGSWIGLLFFTAEFAIWGWVG